MLSAFVITARSRRLNIYLTTSRRKFISQRVFTKLTRKTFVHGDPRSLDKKTVTNLEICDVLLINLNFYLILDNIITVLSEICK